MANSDRKSIVVLGAGVVGLTTAVSLQEQGNYNVTVLADAFPSDPKSVKYTSHWAGAILLNGMSGIDGTRNQLMIDAEKASLEVHMKLAASEGEASRAYLRIPAIMYLDTPLPSTNPLCQFPDFKIIPQEDLPPNTAHGISFTTLTIDPPLHLNYLVQRLSAAGGSLVRGSAMHINAILEGGAAIFAGRPPQAPAAIVNCSGLGARTLGGVEDGAVFPVRGQTVRIHAPWTRQLIMNPGPNPEEHTGVFPRASGDVYLVGTKHEDDWYPAPRPELTRKILELTLALCPEIAPPEVRAVRKPVVEDILPLILEEGVGLRPARKGGVRIQLEWLTAKDGGKVPLVHNYGHAGSGYEGSWGSADEAVKLLGSAFAQ
ncbi:hypothetical protein BD626DRAFT_482205 [Schizophyllum amplum]|uniref:FAD dependent oxidoreductase domain-containing protein n=1 Tax=Schizophyllum amplum TaxID=97359 RepID=A0A550CUW7_9AGAR|nr:hypothetical protein BD626DRAFT_482205 [Auriculariopsis ampla]